MGNTLEKYGHGKRGKRGRGGHYHGEGGYNNGHLGYGPGGWGWYGWPVYPPYYDPIYFSQPPKEEKKDEPPQIIVLPQPQVQPQVMAEDKGARDQLNWLISGTFMVLIVLIIILFQSKN
jgi:hypothetical protein